LYSEVKESYFKIIMKKIYYSVVILALLSIALFTGCKKVNEGPFPSNPPAGGTFNDLSYITPNFPTLSNATGILIAAQVHDQKTVIVTPFQNTYEYGMAQFASTPGNFSSLVSAGSISLNGTSLAASSANSYLSSTSTFSLNLGLSTYWQVGIPGFNYTLNGVYPIYSDSFQNWNNNWLPIYPRTLVTLPTRPTITHLPSTSDPNYVTDTTYYYTNLSAIQTYLSDSLTNHINAVYNQTPQWTVPIKGYIFNADSIYIVLSDGASFFYQTEVSASVDSVAFTPNTFANYPGYNVTTFIMQLNAIKYRDTVVSGKNYYFLKMGSYIKYYGATK
jgi:hypothetical protein